MSPELVQSFLVRYSDCFDTMSIIDVQNKLNELDDSKFGVLMSMSLQKPTIILLIAILLGWERFFLDDISAGVLKVLTCQGLGIWWLIDIFTAQRRTYQYNYRRFTETLMICR